ncbi:pectate lyase [Jiella sp. MQZ9-1]|uniref:Uncharacterized protein n=1 Tax=Jiella flava TaxID=2816857 RepID=A0A939FZW0_9HYPH|nr:hypothetical protein [Jiella flava]MBO0663043.1 hypothetical protein [Jiella flava]MCD2471462.1 pectate lyase [Jiella flava]
MLRHIILSLALATSSQIAVANAVTSDQRALSALERGAAYFRDRLGVDGSYVWKYSADGKVHRGEGGRVPRSIGWIQPPGTPAIGAAYLRIFDVTGDTQWLNAAHDVAKALLRTQLLSGGWYYSAEMDDRKAEEWCYRAFVAENHECHRKGGNRQRNVSVLDDNTSQSALIFLIWFDKASGDSDPAVRAAINYGLRHLAGAQYRNGAFQVFYKGTNPGAKKEFATQATIPAEWPHDWQKPSDPPYFVTNDDILRDTGRMYLSAYRLYGDKADLAIAKAIGTFLVSAQLPAPQPGWAQTYDARLQPVWGRSFEPPAVTSRETAGCIQYLVELYGETGDKAYLDAAGRAGAWLKRVRLPSGLWSRFYELSTNRPLYIDRDDKMTFDDTHLSNHYSLKSTFNIPHVLGELSAAQAGKDVGPVALWPNPADRLDDGDLKSYVADLLARQNPDGHWQSGGWIDSAHFVTAVFALARYVDAHKPHGRHEARRRQN